MLQLDYKSVHERAKRQWERHEVFLTQLIRDIWLWLLSF